MNRHDFIEHCTWHFGFVDANIFVYAFAPEPQFGPAGKELLERIERHDIVGYASSNVLSDVAHRLMSLEACQVFGWPYPGIAARMKQHPAEIKKLSHYRQAIETILLMAIRIISALDHHVVLAAAVSQQFGLLSNDALIVALMQENALTQIASHDSDFDRVPGISRFSPR